MTNHQIHPLILSVEEDPNTLRVRKLVLEGAGYAVLTASSPNDAFELFHNNRVDLVLFDHQLASGEGSRFSQQMKQQRPEVAIAILSEELDEAQHMGYADCSISTTAGPTEMLLAIARLLKP